LTWDYLAGFFDGEGYVNCGYRLRSQGRYRRFAITITQADRDVLEQIQNFLAQNEIPSQVYLQGQRIDKRHPRPCYQLQVTGAENVWGFLWCIEPYLIVKQEQARKGIEMLEELGRQARAGELDPRIHFRYASIAEDFKS